MRGTPHFVEITIIYDERHVFSYARLAIQVKAAPEYVEVFGAYLFVANAADRVFFRVLQASEIRGLEPFILKQALLLLERRRWKIVYVDVLTRFVEEELVF